MGTMGERRNESLWIEMMVGARCTLLTSARGHLGLGIREGAQRQTAPLTAEFSRGVDGDSATFGRMREKAGDEELDLAMNTIIFALPLHLMALCWIC